VVGKEKTPTTGKQLPIRDKRAAHWKIWKYKSISECRL